MNLGSLYMMQEEDQKAQNMLETALKIKNSILGNNHPEIATTLNNLAISYERQGQYELSEKYYRQALRIIGAFLPKEHDSITKINENIKRTRDKKLERGKE